MASSSDIANLGEDGFVDSRGVKIHYVTKGAGIEVPTVPPKSSIV
jgi:hypothetical protein